MLPLLFCALLAEPRIEPPGKAELRLEFSSKKFDPLKPGKETVRGVIINNTGKPIKVPTDYDGKALQMKALLDGKAFDRKPMNLYVRGGHEPKWVELKPGARKVLFEWKLADIMPTKRAESAPLEWGSNVRFGSPASPAVDYRGGIVFGKTRYVLRFNGKGVMAESPKAGLEIVASKK
jgi:hypothetical protein